MDTFVWDHERLKDTIHLPMPLSIPVPKKTEERSPGYQKNPTQGMLLWMTVQRSTKSRIIELWWANTEIPRYNQPIDPTIIAESLRATGIGKRSSQLRTILTPVIQSAIAADVRYSVLSRLVPNRAMALDLYREYGWERLICSWRIQDIHSKKFNWQKSIEESLLYALYHRGSSPEITWDELTRLQWVLQLISLFQRERRECFGTLTNYIITGERALSLLGSDMNSAISIEYCDTCKIPVSKTMSSLCPLCSGIPNRFHGIGRGC